MRYLNLFLIFILFFMTTISSFAKNKIVYFEPKTVKLSGTIKMVTCPGPPNYENIKKGDADETGPYLILNTAININSEPNNQNGNDEPEKNVKLVQLIVSNDNDWSQVKEGNYVEIIGNLSHALTGHHHARILLDIQKIKVLSKQILSDKKLNITDEDRISLIQGNCNVDF